MGKVEVSTRTMNILRLKRESTGLKNDELVEYALINLRSIPVKRRGFK